MIIQKQWIILIESNIYMKNLLKIGFYWLGDKKIENRTNKVGF